MNQNDNEPDDPTEDDGSEYRTSVLDERVRVHRRSTMGDPDQEPTYNSEAADMAQVAQLQREIAQAKERLNETCGFDPKTGERVFRIAGPERDKLQLKLKHLEQQELPYVRDRQRQAAEWRKANVPTPEQKLQAEAEARAAVKARAEERALEIEAEELAQKIVAERRRKVSN